LKGAAIKAGYSRPTGKDRLPNRWWRLRHNTGQASFEIGCDADLDVLTNADKINHAHCRLPVCHFCEFALSCMVLNGTVGLAKSLIAQGFY
jgi:hypothetical protein